MNVYDIAYMVDGSSSREHVLIFYK